jgi:hypothetical protein
MGVIDCINRYCSLAVDTVFESATIQKMARSKAGRVALNVFAGFTVTCGVVIGGLGLVALALAALSCPLAKMAIAVGFLVMSILDLSARLIETRVKLKQLRDDVGIAMISPALPGYVLIVLGDTMFQKNAALPKLSHQF